MNKQLNFDNQTILKHFQVLLKANRLAHAYLFVGPKTVGKYQTALNVAKLLNCEKTIKDGSCETCPSCLKINHGNHPDIHTILDDETKSIKIEQIREMIKKVQMSAFEARIKVFIIKDAETMTPEASNALLRILEEPCAKTVILLTTAHPEKMFDTIRSRCQRIYFSSLNSFELKERLVKDFTFKEEAAHFLSHFSEGCLGEALELGRADFFNKKNQALDQFLFASNDENFSRDFLSQQDREGHRQALLIILSWFRDLMLLKMNVSEKNLINHDRLKDLKNMSTIYSFEELNEVIRDIVRTSKLLEENLNIKMAVTLLKEKICQN